MGVENLPTHVSHDSSNQEDLNNMLNSSFLEKNSADFG